MDDKTNGGLPQREIDDAAIEAFRDIMRRLMEENGENLDKCWPWPETWPASWGDKPKLYSVSRHGKDGYGQFVLLAIPGVAKMRTKPKAHVWAYRFFNLKLDTSLTVKEHEGAEWRGQAFETKAIKDKAGNVIIVLGREIRHGASCPHSCVNPYHLTIGDHWQNTGFDEALKFNDGKLSEKAVNCIDSVIADFEAGEVDARTLCEKHGIGPADLVNIFKLKGLPTEFLGHNFNPEGHPPVPQSSHN